MSRTAPEIADCKLFAPVSQKKPLSPVSGSVESFVETDTRKMVELTCLCSCVNGA